MEPSQENKSGRQSPNNGEDLERQREPSEAIASGPAATVAEKCAAVASSPTVAIGNSSLKKEQGDDEGKTQSDEKSASDARTGKAKRNQKQRHRQMVLSWDKATTLLA